jgi:hypothetical protein
MTSPVEVIARACWVAERTLSWPVRLGGRNRTGQEQMTEPDRIPADGHRGIVLGENGGKGDRYACLV